MRARLRPDLVAQHAEVFLINGDMNSNLYTSSRAMHSAILGLLQQDGSGLARAGVGRLQNLSVSVQRRWANVLSDATRQVHTSSVLDRRSILPPSVCIPPKHSPRAIAHPDMQKILILPWVDAA